MSLTPETSAYWVGPDGAQQGPEPASAVVARIKAGELPPSTQLWWQGAPSWIPASQVPELVNELGTQGPAPPPDALEPAPQSGPPAGAPGGAAGEPLMDGMTDQQLDDEFIGLLDRSWTLFKETEHASAIDEALLGGVITAMVDSGYVAIDVETAGAAPRVTSTGAGTAPGSVAGPSAPPVGGITPGVGHHLRFEEPASKTRVTIDLQHLTADPGTAKVLGHRVIAEIGYGERVPNASQVTQAVRQEVTSAFVVCPEPGTVTFDADISSGYVYAQIDMILEPERYISESLEIDLDLLRRHIASVVYTMRTFIRTRFGS